MQEQTINPNQLNLLDDFIGQEIDYKNDFVEYIPTSSNDSSIVHCRAVTSNPCKTAKTRSDNIIDRLKTMKFTNTKDNTRNFSIHAKIKEQLKIAIRLIWIWNKFGTYGKYQSVGVL